MKQQKRVISMLVLLSTILIVYELLLTWRRTPLATIHTEQKHILNNPGYQPVGRRTLRQLLEDKDITQLPVKIVTDCRDSNSHHMTYSKYRNQAKKNQNQDTIVESKSSSNRELQEEPHQYGDHVFCLDETKLYRDSQEQYGVRFDQLTDTQKKATIVRAVLKNLEHQNQIEVRDKLKHEYLDRTNHYVHFTEKPDELVLKPAKLELEKRHSEEFGGLNQELGVNGVKRRRTEARVLNDAVEGGRFKGRLVQPTDVGVHHMIPPSLLPLTNSTTALSANSSKSNKKKKGAPKMNEDLLKLSGVKVRQSYDLGDRGFPEVFRVNSTVVNDRLKYIDIAVNNTDPSERSATGTSLNPDLLERSKFQQKQMSRFCGQHYHHRTTLPVDTRGLDSLFQHLLYDDTRKIVFCYIPKNGCSNMKRMMLVLNGLLPPHSSKYRRPEEGMLKQVHSFRNLTKAEAVYKLKHYFKFAIVRNPAERLLSAYRNKLESPFIAQVRKVFPDRLKAYILKQFRKPEFETWISANDSSVDIHPTFEETVHFMDMFPLAFYNEHFKPSLELCAPCAVDYDLFLNFKTLEYDLFALMEYLDIPFIFYPEAISHKREPTSDYLEDYYKEVPLTHKTKLFRKLSLELEFYYALHPEEWGMHSHL